MLNSPELGLSDVYPAIRNGEMKLGGESLALPLGSPPLLAFRRVEGERDEASSAPAVGATIIPTDGPAAAYSLVLGALGRTESYRRSEALFDPADMKPRITEPPFVRAMVELSATNAVRGDQPPVGFAEAMGLVGRGEASETLGWPGAVNEKFAAADGAAPRDVEFAPPAPVGEIYSHTRGGWERESHPTSVVLLGVEGRLVGVTTATRNTVTAFQLAQWLTTGDVATGLSSRSTGTLWFRASQAGASGRWLKGMTLAKDGEPVTKIVTAALSSDSPALVPRVPGIDDYLNALAEGVREAPADEAAATATLAKVAARWEEITNRLGRERQVAAYRRHLGETP
jgi:multiple sugar transport system substrate-binding protein